jgi:hypothetical protein
MIVALVATQGPVSFAQLPSAPDDLRNVGGVEGRVVDVNDRPVANLIVSARPDDSRPHVGLFPMTTTDKQGAFVLEHVQAGYVTLDTAKPEDGYPDTRWAVLVDSDPTTLPQVAVAAGRISRGVIIRLGPARGRVIGIVVDQATGRPLRSARWTLVRDDLPDAWVTSSVGEHGEFAVALPARPYSLEVTAPNFEPWRSDDDAEQVPGQYILVSEHEVLRLTVRLRPKDDTQ